MQKMDQMVQQPAAAFISEYWTNIHIISNSILNNNHCTYSVAIIWSFNQLAEYISTNDQPCLIMQLMTCVVKVMQTVQSNWLHKAILLRTFHTTQLQRYYCVIVQFTKSALQDRISSTSTCSAGLGRYASFLQRCSQDRGFGRGCFVLLTPAQQCFRVCGQLPSKVFKCGAWVVVWVPGDLEWGEMIGCRRVLTSAV